MLTEIKNVRQNTGEPNRRWFTDINIDLIVWQDQASNIVGFQICYDKQTKEKSITWDEDNGLSYFLVDSGEYRPGKYKSAPVMSREASANLHRLQKEFELICDNIDEKLANFVLEKIMVEES